MDVMSAQDAAFLHVENGSNPMHIGSVAVLEGPAPAYGDLVRLIAAAELAKNPGYDVSDVARILEFASPSHLTSTAQRIVGTRSASLARLRTGDLIERFRQGRGRSRNV